MSRSGIALFYGNALIYWKSSLQKSFAQSSPEDEYVALAEACNTITWLKNVLNEIFIKQGVNKIYEDNAGSIAWLSDTFGKEFSKKRQIDFTYNVISNLVSENVVSVIKIDSED